MGWEWGLVGTVSEDFPHAHVGNVLGGARKCFDASVLRTVVCNDTKVGTNYRKSRTTLVPALALLSDGTLSLK